MMKTMMIITLLLSISSYAKVCKTKYKAPHSYLLVQSEASELLEKFANSKAIAAKADALLSKLISAKSPVLISWLKKRNLNVNEDIKVIKEWRLYFANNFILRKYPHKEKSVNAAIESYIAKIKASFTTKEFVSRMEKLFSKSQNQSLEYIKSSNLNSDAKKQTLSRIKSIKLYWMKDFKESKFKKYPIEFSSWGVAYDPVGNEINMGLHSLSYPNDETYLAVFAHEIGHSIDSCRWGAFMKGSWPFEKVGKCLRSEESTGAKKRDDSKMAQMLAQKRISKQLITALKLNPTCNKRVYPPAGTQADQLPETFADWFSAEVIAKMDGVDKTKLRQDLCESSDLMKGSSYLPNGDRMRKIYFTHPKLKQSKSKVRYCVL